MPSSGFCGQIYIFAFDLNFHVMYPNKSALSALADVQFASIRQDMMWGWLFLVYQLLALIHFFFSSSSSSTGQMSQTLWFWISRNLHPWSWSSCLPSSQFSTPAAEGEWGRYHDFTQHIYCRSYWWFGARNWWTRAQVPEPISVCCPYQSVLCWCDCWSERKFKGKRKPWCSRKWNYW